jgi:hypothetical protein
MYVDPLIRSYHTLAVQKERGTRFKSRAGYQISCLLSWCASPFQANHRMLPSNTPQLPSSSSFSIHTSVELGNYFSRHSTTNQRNIIVWGNRFRLTLSWLTALYHEHDLIYVLGLLAYCDMTPESCNSSLLGNGELNSFSRKRICTQQYKNPFLSNGSVNTQ